MPASSSAAPTRSAPGALRWFQEPSLWLSVLLVTTVIGFWPTFFSQLTTQTAINLVHGLTATAWGVAAVAQAWLVKTRRHRLHRRVGRWLLLLPPVIVLSGLQVVQVMLRRNHERVVLVRFNFALLDVCVLALFVLFVILAMVSIRQRNVAMHVRWMACTAILSLEPALSRVFLTIIPLAGNFNDSLYLSLFCIEGVLAVLIGLEWRAGRVRLPYPVMLAFFVAYHVLATPVASSQQFQSLAMRLAGE